MMRAHTVLSRPATAPAKAAEARAPAEPIRVTRVPPRVQRVAISHPGDSSEREADRIADTIMRMPISGEPLVQRMCKECSEEEHVQRKADPSVVPHTRVEGGVVQRATGTREECIRDGSVELLDQDCSGGTCGAATKRSRTERHVPSTAIPSFSSPSASLSLPFSFASPSLSSSPSPATSSPDLPEASKGQKRKSSVMEDDELFGQAKSIGGGAGHVGGAVASRVSSLSGGAPLPPAERAFFEPRFGVNLDSVRLHTGGSASELARSVQARAFTVRDQIVFGAGEYRPGANEGRRLLAHELAHTMQQGAVGEGGTVEPMIQRLCHSTNRTSGSPEQIQIQQYLTRNANVEKEYYVRNPAGGNCYYPDLVDTQTKSIWEIKPWTGGGAAAAQLALYVPAAQAECLGGGSWHAGTPAELNALFTAVLAPQFIAGGGAGPWAVPGADPNEFVLVSSPVAGTILFRSVPLEGLPGDILAEMGGGGPGSARRRRTLANLPPAALARAFRLFSPTTGGPASLRARMAAIPSATLRAGVQAAGVLTGPNTPFAVAGDVAAGLPAGIAGGPAAVPHTGPALAAVLGAATPEQKAAIVADAQWAGGATLNGPAGLVLAAGLGLAARQQLYTDVLLTLPHQNLGLAITAMIGAGLAIGGGVPAAGGPAPHPVAGTLGGALPGVSVADAETRFPTSLLRTLPAGSRAAVAATVPAGHAVTGIPGVRAFIDYVRSGPELQRLADVVISDIAGVGLPAYAAGPAPAPIPAIAAVAAPAIGGGAAGAAANQRNRLIAFWRFALRA